ncbi:MAG: putative BRCA1-associated protein, partial [Streblomastix strix]
MSYHIRFDIEQEANQNEKNDYCIEDNHHLAFLQSTDDFEDNERMDNQNIQTENIYSGIRQPQIIPGKIRLFKEQKEITDMETLRQVVRSSKTQGRMLCIHAVPFHVSILQLCQFLEAYEGHIKSIRAIREQDAKSRYMVLIKMDSAENAERVYIECNGKPFNALEPIYCHIVFVADIDLLDPLTKPEYQTDTHLLNQSSQDQQKLPIKTTFQSTYLQYPEDSETKSSQLIEIPTCPVCFERLDSSESGILTILCNHSFHMQCFSQWKDGSCPVCRFSLGPESGQGRVCQLCGTDEALWICLICGHVGCGRYKQGHAVAHFIETNHTFALELNTQRVWDYTRDSYVHRLVQNQEDGKLVEIDQTCAPKLFLRRQDFGMVRRPHMHHTHSIHKPLQDKQEEQIPTQNADLFTQFDSQLQMGSDEKDNKLFASIVPPDPPPIKMKKKKKQKHNHNNFYGENWINRKNIQKEIKDALPVIKSSSSVLSDVSFGTTSSSDEINEEKELERMKYNIKEKKSKDNRKQNGKKKQKNQRRFSNDEHSSPSSVHSKPPPPHSTTSQSSQSQSQSYNTSIKYNNQQSHIKNRYTQTSSQTKKGDETTSTEYIDDQEQEQESYEDNYDYDEYYDMNKDGYNGSLDIGRMTSAAAAILGSDVLEERLNEVAKDYGRLLINQLDEQRSYYESLLEQEKQKRDEMIVEYEHEKRAIFTQRGKLEDQIGMLRKDNIHKEEQISKLTSNFEEMKEEKKKLENRVNDLIEVRTRIRTEKETMELTSRQQQRTIDQQHAHIVSLETQIREIDAVHKKEIEELQQQLQDTIANMEIQSKLISGDN